MNTQTWRKSSFSGNENVCTELSIDTQGARVRDSKNPQGGTLRFTRPAFGAFLTEIKTEHA